MLDGVGQLSGEFEFVIRLAITVWLVAVSVADHRTGRIPNWMTAPMFLGLGFVRLIQGITVDHTYLWLFVAWGLIFLLWMLHFIGGGDAKLLMGLYALFPSMEFTALLALFLLITIVPLLLWEMRGRSAKEVGSGAYRRVATGQLLPTESELQKRGRRYAWTFALPGIVYTWVYWEMDIFRF